MGICLKIFYLSLLNVFALSVYAQDPKKIKLDEETQERLVEEHRIFNGRNFWTMADLEVGRQVFSESFELFESKLSIVLPVCDVRRPPYDWRYIRPSENERVLKYVGNQIDSQFLRWTDSVWVRIAGQKEKFRVGMYCGAPHLNVPNPMNYIPIEVDRSFSENIKWKNTPSELVDGTLLHLASKVSTGSPRRMSAEVLFGASFEKSFRIGLEIWSVRPSEIKMVSSIWKEITNSIEAEKISIEANIDADSQAHMILRLHPKVRDDAANGQFKSTIYLLDARLLQSH